MKMTTKRTAHGQGLYSDPVARDRDLMSGGRERAWERMKHIPSYLSTMSLGRLSTGTIKGPQGG